MSLEQAAALMEERKKRQPLDRGINAGRAAYEGRAPQRSGIGDVPVAQVRSSVETALQQAAAQRQALADTARKQALGEYRNTGTSAAAYDYLRGRPGAAYPVNPVLPRDVPIQKPYEEVTRPGRVSQTQTSKEAKETTKMPTVNRGAMQMPEQGALGQLLDLALPAYLGYKGYQYLTGAGTSGLPAAAGTAAAAALPAGVGGATWSSYPLSDPYYMGEVATTGGTSGAAGASAAGASALPALSAEAGQVGYVWDGTSMIPATAEQIAEASSAGQWTGTAADAAFGEQITASALNSGEISSLSEMAAWAPWLAAGAFVISDAGQQAIDNVASGISDVVGSVGQPIAEGIGELLETPMGWIESGVDAITSIFGAEGGRVRSGLSAAAQRYNLGGYSDGGRLLKGPGDGVSDSIPATIGAKKQPARLADGEFVVPARIVSELGNGSTDAGARKLYAMMDRIQSARKKSVGKGKVAVNSRAEKYLPK